MHYIKILFFIGFLIINTNFSFAQLEAYEIDGEGWAKGNLIEFGINAKGVYGAKTINKPASFHNNREIDNNLFGFLANPLNDGWVDYDGDYFTPGSPEEGFGIEINGTNYNNNNGISRSEIPGGVTGVNIVSSDCFEDIAQILWEGNVDGLNIKRYFSVTKDGLFIQMTTNIQNQTDLDKLDVFFMHNVDPDNNITLSGRYETDMHLISQASSPTDQTCLVTASQQPLLIPEDMDGSHVSFFANDEKARVTFGGFSNRSASQVWYGSDPDFTNTEGAIMNNIDKAISIAFNLGDIPARESVRFTYYYILEEIDDSFIPLISNVTKENTSVCDGDDGKLVFTGLTEGVNYTISYFDDGVFVPEIDYVANMDGTIEITDLDSGTYSEVSLSYSGCSTKIDDVFEILDPFAPAYTITKEDYTNCLSPEGQLIFSGLTPSTNYQIEYTQNGVLIGPQDMVANSSGTIIFDNLSGGIFTDFVVTEDECETPSNEVIEIIGPESTSYQVPEQFYCDDDYDYRTTINLSLLDEFSIGPDIASSYVITYHTSEINAINGINLSELDYITTGESTYELYAKKTSILSGCYSYLPFTINVNLPSVIDLKDDTICLNSKDLVNYEYSLPILDTGLSSIDHNFEWYYEGIIIPDEISSMLTAETPGNYSVKATTIATGCNYTKQITVSPSGPPRELDVMVTSLPFSGNHTVEITAIGYGEYIYSVDNNSPQESNVFMNLKPGYHTFEIIDTNGCGSVSKEVIIIDYPKFFTPNNDSVRDHWQIIGAEYLIEPQIYIFNRYGKTLKLLDPREKGWDGTFNGIPLPEDDYWFKVIFKDYNNTEHDYFSHFTLKR